MPYRTNSLWSSTVFSTAASLAMGLALTGASLLIFSAFVYYMMDSIMFMDFFAGASLTVGAFTSSFITGKHRRRRGLAEGALCGAMMYAVLMLCGLLTADSIPEIKKLLLLVLSGAAGGVTGVNTRRPAYLMDQ